MSLAAADIHLLPKNIRSPTEKSKNAVRFVTKSMRSDLRERNVHMHFWFRKEGQEFFEEEDGCAACLYVKAGCLNCYLLSKNIVIPQKHCNSRGSNLHRWQCILYLCFYWEYNSAEYIDLFGCRCFWSLRIPAQNHCAGFCWNHRGLHIRKQQLSRRGGYRGWCYQHWCICIFELLLHWRNLYSRKCYKHWRAGVL